MFTLPKKLFLRLASCHSDLNMSLPWEVFPRSQPKELVPNTCALPLGQFLSVPLPLPLPSPSFSLLLPSQYLPVSKTIYLVDYLSPLSLEYELLEKKDFISDVPH